MIFYLSELSLIYQFKQGRGARGRSAGTEHFACSRIRSSNKKSGAGAGAQFKI